jgi:hypothetical protein
MNKLVIDILFYILAGMGVISFIVLLFKIRTQAIDKMTITWLIVGFICIVFPVVSDITIEFGDLKVSLKKAKAETEEVAMELERVKSDNEQLKAEIEELGIIVVNSRELIMNRNVTPDQKAEAFNRLEDNIQSVNSRSAIIDRQLETSIQKNNRVVKELESTSKNFKYYD